MNTQTKLTLVVLIWFATGIAPVIGLFFAPYVSAGFLAGMSVSTALAFLAVKLASATLVQESKENVEEIMELKDEMVDD